MQQFIHLRRRVGGKRRVTLAGCAEVLRDLDQETASHAFVPRPCDQPWVAPNPAGLKLDGEVIIAANIRTHVDLHPVRPVVPVTIRDEMQFLTVHVCRPVVTLSQPTVGTSIIGGHLVRVCEDVLLGPGTDGLDL